MAAKTQELPDITALARRALERDVAWRVKSLSRHLVAIADRVLEATGLSHAQFILMCLIASATDDTVNALAQRAGLDQSTMSRNLDVLVKAQLAEVTAALGDRRRRAVWLTERGLFALARAISVASELQPKMAKAAQGLALPGVAKRGSVKKRGATPARRR